MMNWLKVLRIDKELPLPRYASDGAGGIDLYSAEDIIIGSSDQALVKTGVAIIIPKGFVGVIKDRSSRALDYFYTHAGVIDSDYRGEVKVLLYNDDSTFKPIKRGERIAQMLIVPCPQFIIQEAISLDETVRGEEGFGSTGVA